MPPSSPTGTPHVGLFVTCLVDLMRPSVGFAAVKLLEASGCTVDVPRGQTCCGQPAHNAGDKADTKAIARQTIEAFEGYDYVIAPSGSCAGMLSHHYPRLFADDPAWGPRATAFAAKVHELVSFLTDVRGLDNLGGLNAVFNGRVTYHDSCAGLRELGIKSQPRALLAKVDGLELVEMDDSEICCGFGGTFSLKYGDISNAMVDKKVSNAAKPEPDLLLAGDLGCLLNMAGKLKRKGTDREDGTKASTMKLRHVAEVLAGELSAPAIGEPED